MVRLADGDRDAFAPAYAVLWPLVASYCRRALGDADGEDTAQEALVKLFERAAEFDREREALPWALGIAAWECRSVRRRSGRRAEAPIDGPAGAQLASGSPSAEDALIERDLLACAAELLGTLAPDDLETLTAAWSGDAAARAGVAPATFRKRVERALARLRAAWRSRHGVL